VLETTVADGTRAVRAFRLTREVLAEGVCAYLGTSAKDRAEFTRRARAVIALLEAAGVPVDSDIA
jgi:adenylylsulfate kinase-like enzyme